jgi:hypothetical protein
MFFNDHNIKQGLLKAILLHAKGEGTFKIFHASLLEMDVPIHK